MLGVELTVMQNAATSDMERAYEVCPISPCTRAQVSGPYRDGPASGENNRDGPHTGSKSDACMFLLHA